MAIGNRPPAPKTPKIKNSELIQWYKYNFPYCELSRLEGKYITTGVETHHIEPGLGRTDELWNLIRIVHWKHMLCTTHIYGAQAVQNNYICFGLKFIKGEIKQAKLEELGKWDEVRFVVKELRPIYNQVNGIKS
jgi:hypothetical protein